MLSLSFCVSVCKNCYELNGLTAWGVIFGDLLFTGGVILIIYLCTRNGNGTQKKGTEYIYDLRSHKTHSTPVKHNTEYSQAY